MFLLKKTEAIAFDISPVNTVLNYYANSSGLIMTIKVKYRQDRENERDFLDDSNGLEFYQKTVSKIIGI